jgi:hypothetical protein
MASKATAFEARLSGSPGVVATPAKSKPYLAPSV